MVSQAAGVSTVGRVTTARGRDGSEWRTAAGCARPPEDNRRPGVADGAGAAKNGPGRLALGLPIDEWLALAERAPGVTMVPLERSALVLGARLDDMHGDPVDRWLVATAKLRQYTLLTADTTVLEFGRRERMTKMGDVRR